MSDMPLHLPEKIVHHLYKNGSAVDLVPYCGVTPGLDAETGDWHTGHDRDVLLECLGLGLTSCTVCLSPEALGGWTPLILDEVDRGEV